jgi:hypothetical protein
MKSLANWMVAATVLTVAAGSASAQVLKAEIPFAFQVGDAKVAPGSYTLSVNAGDRVMRLTNSDSRQTWMAVASSPMEVRKAAQVHGVLTFECAGARCALRSIWDGVNLYGYQFPRIKAKGEAIRVAVIPLTRGKSE